MSKLTFGSPCIALVALLASPLAAQDTPDQAFAARPCANDVHAGFSTTQGNSDTLSLALGADACRERSRGRWEIDLDGGTHRTAGQAATERIELEGVDEIRFGNDWVISLFGSAETDRASALDSRFLAGAGIGQERAFNVRARSLHAGVHGGVAYTRTDESGGETESFPEAWFKSQVAVPLNKQVSLNSKLQGFSNFNDTSDYRLDHETDVTFRFATHFALRTAVEMRWDAKPASGAKEFDLSTQTMLVFSFGKPQAPPTSPAK